MAERGEINILGAVSCRRFGRELCAENDTGDLRWKVACGFRGLMDRLLDCVIQALSRRTVVGFRGTKPWSLES